MASSKVSQPPSLPHSKSLVLPTLLFCHHNASQNAWTQFLGGQWSTDLLPRKPFLWPPVHVDWGLQAGTSKLSSSTHNHHLLKAC